MAPLISFTGNFARRSGQIASIILFACSLDASTITVGSSAATVQNNSGMPTQNIDTNPVWAAPLGTSSWVSITTTGSPPDANFVTLPNGTDVAFTQTFTLDGPVASASLDVLADDTTDVILNGHMIMPATTTLGPHCASAPIGCLTVTEGQLQTADFGQFWNVGANTLEFDTQQLGSQSFGLDFTGTIVTTTGSTGPTGGTGPVTVPEPSAASLGGAGLLALLLLAVLRSRSVARV